MTIKPKKKIELRGPFQCKLCSVKIQTRVLMKRHGVDRHFFKKMQTEGNLSTKKPFQCNQEQCDFQGETAQTLARHFGIKHRGMDQYMTQLLGEKINNITKSPVKAEIEDKAENLNKKKAETKELWVVKKNKKSEAWVVNPPVAKTEDAALTSEDEAEKTDHDDNASVVSVASASSSASKGSKSSKSSTESKRGRRGGGPSNMEEFRKALKENLRTKDGSYCIAKDKTNIECVCGKIVRICNPYYWKYLVQKPRVVNGKLYARGHWYICEEVKRRGSEYQLSEQEKLEIKKELESSRKGNFSSFYWFFMLKLVGFQHVNVNHLFYFIILLYDKL